MQFVNAMNALEISLRWLRIEDKFEEILILLRASDIFATYELYSTKQDIR